MLGERKYFLDWLRVAAFGFLILFHVGLLYVTWNYNIKSSRIFPELEYLLIAISPWRLELLFFISGVASRFLIEKLGPGRFSLARIKRLYIVLLLGMLVINPIQVYVEFLHKGLIDPGYFDFWLHAYLPGKPFPHRVLPTWDHLWFLVYLLIYTLGMALIFKLFHPSEPFNIPLNFLLITPGIWLCASNALIQEYSPVTMALVNDWGNHLRWIGMFAAGVICASRGVFWVFVKAFRHRLLALSIIGLFFQIGYGVLARANAISPDWYGILYGVVEGFYGWAVILTLTGYASAYLNFNNKVLRYLTDAVLPVYVVHQPILLVAAYLLLPISLPLSIEVTALILITGVGSLAVYEIFVRRWRLSRFLFGLKGIERGSSINNQLDLSKVRS